MSLKRYCVIAVVAIMAMVLPAGSSAVVAQEYSPEFSPGLHRGWMLEPPGSWIDANDITFNRTYQYYIPSSYDGSEAVPLLFMFHGFGGNGDLARSYTRFDELAEQEGFIAVFPDAFDLTGHECAGSFPPGGEIGWLVAPEGLQFCAGVDDPLFVWNMIGWFKDNYNIDASRIYSTGFSMGAMLSFYLNIWLGDTFAAIAPVGSPMPWWYGDLPPIWHPPFTPMTMILMHGTDDPILWYRGYGGTGGPLTFSVDMSIAFWCGINGINMTSTEPEVTTWGPTAEDSTEVTRYVYSGGTDGAEVILFKVEGGGHTWPGAMLPYPPHPLLGELGEVSTHIDGSALIWKHLPPEKYYLRTSSTLGGNVNTPGRNTFANVESTGAFMFFYPGTGDVVVNLEAVPKTDRWEFVNWTGDVSTVADVNSATTTITITPDDDYEIVANFIGQYDLTIDSTEGGDVTTPGEGLFPDYDAGTVVDLVATPDAGYRFLEWAGDVSTVADVNSATTTITITPDDDYEIVANFIGQYDLTIDSTEGGDVTTPGEGLFRDYDAGTVVDLVATPDAGYRFLEWAGDVAKIDDPYAAEISITMEGNYVITASFEERPSGGMCFIATAAYGTSAAKPLDVLREFRDEVLLESTFGSRLVDLYYHFSSPIADFVSEDNFVRTVVRELMIDPIVWLAEATKDIWRN
jgi:polyhydroxybutyrate depolymerase